MPTASIVIPLYGQWPLTEACLRSLAVSTLDVPDLEVLAVDNGAAVFPAEGAACAALGRALFGARFRYLPQPKTATSRELATPGRERPPGAGSAF